MPSPRWCCRRSWSAARRGLQNPAFRSLNGGRSWACCRRYATADWQEVFEKYQAIPQYRALNRGMILADFKTIYWWEWTHRLLGRVIGAAFLLPFLWFLWRGWIPASCARGCGSFCAWRAARRGRLVDGCVRPVRTDRGFAISAGDASHPRQRHLCRAHLDGACDEPPAVPARAGPVRAPLPSRSCSCANLSRRAGRRIARGLRLQYLAVDRRRADTELRGSVVPDAAVAEFFRKYSHRAIRSPHDRVRDLHRRPSPRDRCRCAR